MFENFKDHFKRSLLMVSGDKMRDYAIQTSLLNDKNNEYYYLEFGVYKGGTANFFSKYVKKLYAFDSFEGLSEDWIGKGAPKGTFNLNKKIPKLNSNVEPIIGWVEDTLDDFLKKHNPKINFVHMDFDIYSPTKFTLKKLKPFLIKNSIFFSIYFVSVCEFFKQNYLKNYKFIFLLIAPFLIPYNFYQSFQLIPEESYLIFLIPSIFLYILSESKNRIFLTIIFIITLYTKSPNIIIILSLSLILFTKYFKINARGLILISLIISILLWGSYGYKKSQFFPFFHKSYTVNSFTGLQSHNIFFKYFYPEYTVDEIVSYFDFFKQNSTNKSEKNYEKILSSEKSKFIKKNFLEYLEIKLTILNHMFFNIKKD